MIAIMLPTGKPANNNMHVAFPTTPTQYFHLLRQIETVNDSRAERFIKIIRSHFVYDNLLFFD